MWYLFKCQAERNIYNTYTIIEYEIEISDYSDLNHY